MSVSNSEWRKLASSTSALADTEDLPQKHSSPKIMHNFPLFLREGKRDYQMTLEIHLIVICLGS